MFGRISRLCSPRNPWSHRFVVPAVLLAATGCGIAYPSGLGGAPGRATSGDYFHYVISDILLPRGGGEFARDIDGDGTVDDALGSIFSTFSPTFQGALSDAIRSGNLVVLSSIRADSLSDDAEVSWQLYRGAPQPALQLDGQDAVTVAANSPADWIASGAIQGGIFAGLPTRSLPLPINLGAGPFDLPIYSVTLEGRVRSDECGVDAPVQVAGAVRKTDFDAVVAPAFAAAVNQTIAQACNGGTEPPDCGCADPYRDAVTRLDINPADCNITAAEVQFALTGETQPELDLFNGNTFAPGVDGVFDSLGIGLGLWCTAAAFDAPTE